MIRSNQYVMAYQGITLGTGELDLNTFEIDNTWGLGMQHLRMVNGKISFQLSI